MTLNTSIDPTTSSMNGMAKCLEWVGYRRNERGQVVVPCDVGIVKPCDKYGRTVSIAGTKKP